MVDGKGMVIDGVWMGGRGEESVWVGDRGSWGMGERIEGGEEKGGGDRCGGKGSRGGDMVYLKDGVDGRRGSDMC